MQLIRLLNDIATDLEQQTRAIRDAATAASEVEADDWDAADEMASAVHARLVVMQNWCRHYAKKLEAKQ